VACTRKRLRSAGGTHNVRAVQQARSGVCQGVPLWRLFQRIQRVRVKVQASTVACTRKRLRSAGGTHNVRAVQQARSGVL
jgi:hypothetical protein